MKYSQVIFIVLCALMFLCKESAVASASSKQKIGIVFSQVTENYATITRPGGTLNGQIIDPKIKYSSFSDKRLKFQLLLDKYGYEYGLIIDRQLADINHLKQYDSIIFPNTVMMSKEQRQAVKEYIRLGGGAILAFTIARNEATKYPNGDKDLDLSPLIYDTKTWIWEWDNLSEVFQSAFINDVVIKNYQIKPIGNHPIISNTLKKLGKGSFQLENNRPDGEWIEVIKPYPGAHVTPLLEYSSIGSSSVPAHTPKQTGAAYAFEFGQGKAVYLGFKSIDHIGIDENVNWEDVKTRGLAWDGLSGGQDLEVFLMESLAWTAERGNFDHPIDRNVSISITGESSYLRANDYVFYATVTSESKGNTISRGTMVVELIGPDGQKKASYERIVPGLVPYGKSYPEKVQFTIPKNSPTGIYTLKTYYHNGRSGKDGLKIAGDTKIFHIQPKKAVGISPFLFKDVGPGHWAARDIYNLIGTNIMNGTTHNTNYYPDRSITRLEAATLITNALGLSLKNRPDPKLTDVKRGQAGYDVIAAVVDEGIFSGSNEKFNANSTLTREQMAKILVTAFRLSGQKSNSFSDIKEDRWSKPYIDVLVSNRITVVSGQFRPQEITTKAQFSAFLQRSIIRHDQ
ncbi:S-layer homology domain-containing protein [Bacillus sp. FJAT-29790]|uniref:S-layer homology domain-containing protein n=1 Tax=Bacillus sp. FJAT-29790 TaxID=1895002 RepID=UPI001C2147E3|nr:S-layer homology domain-containing protein [Bacillus sp. FJAT-29790]MBU8881136.1 S-layer homology domain-containing protein [Bacillus sp. FJAT-29790]